MSTIISRTFDAGFRYRTCRPDEYIVKSGLLVDNEIVCKKAFQWPWQRVTIVTLAPRNYTFTLHCISKDLVPFDLPVVFTIGPYDPTVDMDSFRRYASKMSAMTAEELQDVVLGCIHGQTRLYAAGLTVLEMFGDRDSFKMHVQERIAKELLSFGLQVFNANVSEMRDSGNNEYFSSLKQKAISSAVNEARVQVATAKREGDIGEKSSQNDTRMRLAEIKKEGDIGEMENQNATRMRLAAIKKEGDIAVSENVAESSIRIANIEAKVVEQENLSKQNVERSRLDLELVNIGCKEDEDTRKVEARIAPLAREAELQAELNRLDGIKQLEFLRATDLARTTVTAESKLKEAEAQALAQRMAADADLYAAQQHAEGIKATMEAKAAGMRELLSVADPALVKFWLSLENGLFEKLAETTAAAVQGLQPKINVWKTGGSGGDPLQKLFTSLPPMLDALESQTNIKMPSWMPQSVPQEQA